MSTSIILKSLFIFLLGICLLCSAQATSNLESTLEETVVSQYITESALKPITASTARHIAQTVYWYSDQHKIDPMLVLALMRQESGFNPSATSREGAKGLMQVLPRAHRLELKGKSPTNIEVNVGLGIQIYSDCLKSKGNISGALKCYSGGAGKKYSTSVLSYMHKSQRYVIEHLFNNTDVVLASNSN